MNQQQRQTMDLDDTFPKFCDELSIEQLRKGLEVVGTLKSSDRFVNFLRKTVSEALERKLNQDSEHRGMAANE